MFNENTEELAQSKLILLYIISSGKTKIESDKLTEIVMEEDLFNFFILKQYLSELENSQLILKSKIGKKEYYQISEKGQATLDLFPDRLDPSLIDRLDLSIKSLAADNLEARSSYINLDKDKYILSLDLSKEEDLILSMDINLQSLDQVKLVEDSWLKNYKKILSDLSIKLDEN